MEDGYRTLHDDWHLIACETAMHAAIRNNHKEIVHLLLTVSKTQTLHCLDRGGRPPLLAAVQYGDQEIIETIDMHATQPAERCGLVARIEDVAQLNE
ncbi:hypothetical protein DPMN_035107 [Dreissena polymorpha]|uniref:Uncharacterized protein n=1 Tax=Dreissena polymorpha TaxID=45954 RepID=A0A9D4RML0_DREPO|nr:hypothetical protein DPMN_035107 [Dreissena polymorpha]